MAGSSKCFNSGFNQIFGCWILSTECCCCSASGSFGIYGIFLGSLGSFWVFGIFLGFLGFSGIFGIFLGFLGFFWDFWDLSDIFRIFLGFLMTLKRFLVMNTWLQELRPRDASVTWSAGWSSKGIAPSNQHRVAPPSANEIAPRANCKLSIDATANFFLLLFHPLENRNEIKQS